jgi:nucleoside-diphosphate-sugar epimerase
MKILLLGSNGYIGSKFYDTYQTKHDITAIDLNLFGSDLGFSSNTNYKNISPQNYEVVICLAGHSSVSMCEYNPDNAWINNVDYFKNLCNDITSQKFIYASSASVYGANVAGLSIENSPINFNPLNHYDLQKITIDLIANKYIKEGKNIIGLRFGTVNGPSINTRSDLIINSMVKSALEIGKIKAKNLHIRRAILGINDLVKALEKICTTKIECGQYNLASFNSSVGEITNIIKQRCNADVELLPDDAFSYDFQLSTEKIRKNLSFEFTDSINTLIDELIYNHPKTVYSIRNTDGNFKNE